METEEQRKYRQQTEFCPNDIHDWKYIDVQHRECKECGKKQYYEKGSEWVNEK